MRGKIVMTEKPERYSSWPFREGFPLPRPPALPPNTSLTTKHQYLGSGLLIPRPENTNVYIHPEPNRLLETLPIGKSQRIRQVGQCFLMAVWYKVTYSWETKQSPKTPKAKHWPRWERWSWDKSSLTSQWLRTDRSGQEFSCLDACDKPLWVCFQ